jgi:hypothetical protein
MLRPRTASVEEVLQRAARARIRIYGARGSAARIRCFAAQAPSGRPRGGLALTREKRCAPPELQCRRASDAASPGVSIILLGYQENTESS